MTITRDQTATPVATTTSSITLTWPTPPAAGAKVIVKLYGAFTTPTSVVDNGTVSRTFTQDATQDIFGVANVYIYRADAITLPGAGSYAVTITLSASGNAFASGRSYLGVATGGPAAANGSTGTSNSPSSGSVTPAAAGSLCAALAATDSGLNPETITLTSAGWSAEATFTNGGVAAGAVADTITAGTSAQQATWSLGDSPDWVSAIAVYSPAGAAGPVVNPAWLAARSGLPGDTAAVNASSQVGQFLALHGITPVYAGTALITPSGLVGYGYGNPLSTSLGSFDVDQPFTMPGGHTVTGRVTLPLVPSGSGADVTVSLCADSGGNPGTVITSVVLPKEHLAQLAAASGLPGGALATASFNRLVMGDMTSFSWQSPVAGSGSPSVASFAQSGQYQVQAGGNLTSGAAYTAAAFTVGWQGGSAPGTVLPQPPLPAAVNFGTLIATNDVLVYAGGQPTSGTVTANVSAAGWSPSSGQVQSWTAQTSLPQAVFFAAGAFDPASDTVYVIGGETNAAGGSPTTAVWRCTVSNGQLGSWSACPPLPAARQGMAAAVINGWLVACGGNNSSVLTTDTWCAPVGSGGTIGSWRPGPAMPASGGVPSSYAVTSAGMLVFSATLAMTLTVTADGPGTWRSQTVNSAAITAGAGQPCTAFAISGGQYQVITISPATGQYASGILYSVPAVSVPLPATGLTGGGTYHILLHQQGGTAADYVSVIAGPGAQSSSAQTRPAGGGSWTPMSGHLYSLYAGVFDQAASGLPLHFWEDSGARVTTLVYGSASGLLLGFAEATAFPSGSPRPVMPSVTEVTWSGGQPSGLVTLA